MVAGLGPAPRVHHALASARAPNPVVLFGGDLGRATLAADTWAWDGEFWTQVAEARLGGSVATTTLHVV